MKFFKKLLAVVLAAVMFVSVAENSGYGICRVSAAVSSSKDLAVGAKSYGFTLKEKVEYEDSEDCILNWEHDKTGAQVYFLVNDDPERAFGIMFKTEPTDDTGKLHILEHASCAASEKYPGRDVFMDLISMGFITDMNASTVHSSTNYYVSSLDEDQLFNAADFYLDCSFHSAIRTNPNYFYREGWRYVMEDKDSPLDVTGIVYNEMQGVLGSIDEYTISTGLGRYLYPDSDYVYESGGIPEKILDLTYDELIEFYDQCYHPSNSTTVVYGDVDYEKWLKKLATEYFDSYEKEEFKAPEKYVPKGNYGTVSIEFPVYEGTEDLSGRLLYAWDLPDELSYVEFSAFGKLTSYMNLLTSPVMQALNASGIGSSYETFTYSIGDQRQLCVYAYDADTSRAEEFKEIVDKAFKELLKNGLNKDLLDAMFEKDALAEALATNTSGIGVAVILQITAAVEAQDMSMITASDLTASVKKLFDDNKVLPLFEKSVVKNKNNVLIAATPKPGLTEANDKALADKLAAKKAAMSEAEINSIVEATKAFNEWNENEGTNESTMAKLVTAKAKDIEITRPEFKTTETEQKGVKIYTAEVDNDASYYRYFFDISNLSKKQVQALNEYIKFLGLSTANRTQEEVTNELSRYLTGLSAEIKLQTINGKDIPALVIGFYAFPENLDKALDLIFDMLYNTDIVSNSGFISQYLYYYYSNLTDPESMGEVFLGLAGGESDYSRRLQWLLSGIPRFEYLEKVLSGEEALNKLLTQMDAVRKKVVKRQNGVIYVIGRADTFKKAEKLMMARFPKKLKTYKTGSIMKLKKTPKTSGIIMNTSASYLVSYYKPKDPSVKETAARMLAMSILQDQLYLPQFRFAMGAYGGYCGATKDGFVYSELYRSPGFAEAYQIIGQAPEYLEQILSQIKTKDLNGYKLQLISQLITPSGELNMAVNELYYKKAYNSSNIVYDIAAEIEKLTVKDLKKQVKSIAKIYKKSGTAVIGTEEEIKANADMFDKIYEIK